MYNKSQETIDLDIQSVKWNHSGIREFCWQYDSTELISIRDELLCSLPSLLRANIALNNQAAISIGVLFKWVICELLKAHEASALAQLNSGLKNVNVPRRFRMLYAIKNDVPVESLFIHRAEQPKKDTKLIRLGKKFIRELQWNFSANLLRKLKPTKKITVLQANKLLVSNARGEKAWISYSQESDWFIKIPKNILLTDLSGSDKDFVELMLAEFMSSMTKRNLEIHPQILAYLNNLLLQTTNFVSFHLCNLKNSKKIPEELWTGCAGASIWTRTLAYAVMQTGGHVKGHDHGFGNAHIEQLAHHYTNYNCVNEFQTYNSQNVLIKEREFNKELVIFNKTVKISASKKIQYSKSVSYTYGTISSIMYLPTAFHSEGTRLRPILSDVQYFDWQCRLMNFIKSLNVSAYYKPHPEGRVKVPENFPQNFGFQNIQGAFESTNQEVDAYIIDFCASTTTAQILMSNKPVFFLNPGYPKLFEDAKASLEKRCYILDMWFCDKFRLHVDWKLFEELINRKQHKYNNDFVASHYAGIQI